MTSGACPRAARSADPGDELNAWLLDRCVAYAKANRHPELTDQTIWQVFEAERAKLVPISGRFDGFRATQASVSKTCLVRFDNNKSPGFAYDTETGAVDARQKTPARGAGVSGQRSTLGGLRSSINKQTGVGGPPVTSSPICCGIAGSRSAWTDAGAATTTSSSSACGGP